MAVAWSKDTIAVRSFIFLTCHIFMILVMVVILQHTTLIFLVIRDTLRVVLLILKLSVSLAKNIVLVTHHTIYSGNVVTLFDCIYFVGSEWIVLDISR